MPEYTRLLRLRTHPPTTFFLWGPRQAGKSTLLATWLRALPDTGIRRCWLTLDDNDNDPTLLATYIAYSLNCDY